MKRKHLLTILIVAMMLLFALICHAETVTHLDIIEDEQGIWGRFDTNYNDDNSLTNDAVNLMSESDVYSTAPEIVGYDVRTSSIIDENENVLNIFRVRTKVSYEQNETSKEHGFIYALTKDLEENDEDLTLETTSASFGKVVTFGKTPYDSSSDEYAIYSESINVLEQNFTLYLTIRTYAIYEVDGEEVVAYGDLDFKSYYRMAKAIVETYGEECSDFLTGNVEIAETNILTSAEEKDLSSVISDHLVGTDIYAIKFVPDDSGFYTLNTNSDGVTYELLDEYGSNYTGVEINDETTYTAYLFEKNNTYYVRMTGEMNSSYSITATPCLQEAIIYDFAEGAGDFTCGNEATGTVEDGIFKVSIDKSYSLTKAYIQNSNLSLDLLDYSRLIIRMKNTTDTTALSGTVGIDLEYDGSSTSYTLDSSMQSGMTEFENIEFDFTTRYGNVSSLKLSFGEILKTVSGDIYIDSIAIIPMPEVLSWEFDETIENWSYNAQIETAVVEDGALVLDMLGSVTGMSPAIISPGTSAYDIDKYDVLTICLKNETDATNMHVYFSTLENGHDSFNENKKFVIEIESMSDEFIEYTINLSEHDYFTDSLKSIMISIPTNGTASIDYIRLSKQAVEHEVVWDFEDNTLQGFTSSNNRHTLSVEDGVMIVETVNLNIGALYSPKTLELDTSEYRFLVLGVNSASETANFEVYFSTSTTNGYFENDSTNKVVYKQIIQITKSDEFNEYVIDLATFPSGWSSAYTGILNELMCAITTPGTFKFDYIEIR